jgi:hypothetical protein
VPRIAVGRMQPAAAEIEREGRTVPGRPGPSAEPRPRLHDQAVDARLGEPPARRDSGRAPADDRHFPIAVGQTPFRDGRIRSLLRSLHEASATANLSQQRVLPRFHGLSHAPEFPNTTRPTFEAAKIDMPQKSPADSPAFQGGQRDFGLLRPERRQTRSPWNIRRSDARRK